MSQDGPKNAKVVNVTVDEAKNDEAKNFITTTFEKHRNLKYEEIDVENLLVFLRNGNKLDVIRPIHAERTCRAIPYHGSVIAFLEKMKKYDTILYLFELNEEETWLANIM
jgi:hypothetical protein